MECECGEKIYHGDGSIFFGDGMLCKKCATTGSKPISLIVANAIKDGKDATGLCTVKDVAGFLINDMGSDPTMKTEMVFNIANTIRVHVELEVTRIVKI